MKKRIVGTLMALLLAVTVLPPGAISVTSADVTTGLVTTAYAEEHQNHCICGAEHKTIGGHISEVKPETWKPVSSLSEIQQDGYYYLTQNVELSSGWSAIYKNNGGTGTGYDNNVVLCLNGHSIDQSDSAAVISVARGCTITITDCKSGEQQGEIKHVVDSRTGTVHYHHGVYVTYGTFNMYGGRITGNTSGYVDSSNSPVAGEGGGVYVGDGYSSSSNAVFNMYGGTITGNKADQGGAGGGVYVESGRTFNMYGGAISNNSATEGGGVYVTSNATFTMSGGTIGENTASNKGGGVFVESGATFTMSGTASITKNTAGKTDDYGFGGGVYSKGTFNLSGGAITQNTANCAGFTNKLGGGVMAAGGKLNLSGNPVVKNNTGKDTDNVRVSGSTIAVTDALTEGAEIVLNSLNGATIAGNSAYYTRTDNGDSVTLTAPTDSSGGETTEHKHCVCGTGTLGHTHDADVTWIGVAALSEITTAGNYYLKKDITLENTWNVPTAGVVLCLNGKTVTAKQTGIIVPANSTLTLTDCKPDGKDGCISGNKWRGIEINGGGSLTIYAGKIEKFNTGLEVLGKGTFTMYGGTIADNLASGVVVQDGGNAVISGGTITRNSTGVSLYGKTLTVDGNAVITNNSNAGIEDSGALTIGGNANITGNGSWERVNVNMFCVEEAVPAPITVRDDFNGKFGLTTSLQDGTKVINGTVKDTITCDSSRKTIDADGKIQQATSVPVEGVALNKQGLSLTEGGTETLTATITPANATNKNVTWSSSNTAVATVENGVVTAVSVGTATITVTTEDGGKATCCEVTVTAAQTGHVHVKGEQKYNESEHWYICTVCSEKLDVGAHVYDNDTDTTCNTCGYVRTISGGGESGGDTPTPTPTPTPEAPRYYYSSGSGSTGAGGLSAVQNDPNGKSATDYNGGIYGLIFKSYANFSSFQGVQVDGKTIAPANYIAEEGSIEVYLKAVYLRTLAAGKHTVTILSSEGNATAEFTVGGVVSAPKTADAGALAYLGLALSSYVGTALVTRRKKEF